MGHRPVGTRVCGILQLLFLFYILVLPFWKYKISSTTIFFSEPDVNLVLFILGLSCLTKKGDFGYAVHTPWMHYSHAYIQINTTSIHSRIVWKHSKCFIFIYYLRIYCLHCTLLMMMIYSKFRLVGLKLILFPFWIYHGERCVKLIFSMCYM